MRRQDFEIVAQAMLDAYPGPHNDRSSHAQWRECCEKLADAFAAQSSAFDRKRFLHNCGYGHN